MGPLLFTEQRLSSFLSEIHRLKQSEFPYKHSEIALNKIQETIEQSLNKLAAISPRAHSSLINQRCAIELNQAIGSMPIMGCLLRSTNVRNAFEIFRPLHRLSQNLLAAVHVNPADVKLILSSEWDYSPFIYQTIPYLSGYVIVGIPSTESSNPLIFPLAGHELGHTVWAEANLSQKFEPLVAGKLTEQLLLHWDDFVAIQPIYASKPKPATVSDILSDMTLVELLEDFCYYSLMQVEETFCDFLGLRIFGEGYLYAFAYLISPSWGEYRSFEYPNYRARAENLTKAASIFGLESPANYIEWFDDLLAQGTPLEDFLLKLSDNCLPELITILADEVSLIISNSSIILPDKDEQYNIKNRLNLGIPAENIKCLADIINAGWIAHNDVAFLENIVESGERKHSMLRDLLLKSVEILDVETILKENK